MSLAADIASMLAAAGALVGSLPTVPVDVEVAAGAAIDGDGAPYDNYAPYLSAVPCARATSGKPFGVSSTTVSGRTDQFGKAVEWLPWTLTFTVSLNLDTRHRIVLADDAGVVHYLYVVGTSADTKTPQQWVVYAREFVR